MSAAPVEIPQTNLVIGSLQSVTLPNPSTHKYWLPLGRRIAWSMRKVNSSIGLDLHSNGWFAILVSPPGSHIDMHAEIMTFLQTLWHALKPGGAYVVEDISENYIEKPFREPLPPLLEIASSMFAV